MAHGRDHGNDVDDEFEDQRLEPQGAPMPPIQGVRTPPPASAATPFDFELVAVDPIDDPSTADATNLDPWGAHEAEAELAAAAEVDVDVEVEVEVAQYREPEPVAPAGPRRGGGILTIPLLCVGVAIIACVTLLPVADENHQLAWEREKLRADLAQLKEQGRVNGEFLERVADDATLAQRLAQRQMRYIREGTSVLRLRGGQAEEMSPFHLVSVPPPPPMPPYEPVGGALATLVRQPRAQLYLSGIALLLIATGLVLGYVPKSTAEDME